MPRHLFFIILVILLTFKSICTCFAHLSGGYIEVTANPASLVCQVRLFLYSEIGSSVYPGNGDLNFGDGSKSWSPNHGNPDEFVDLGNQMGLNIYNVSHAFPGPGIYKLSYRESNRNAGISNILNSVNTPFCIETMINIDPFIGNNSSPHIANHFPVWTKTNSDFLYSISATDAENDSLSYSPATPLQNAGIKVDSFFAPMTIRDDVIISQMFVTCTTGNIIWQHASPEGVYQYSVRIDEWRNYNGSIINIGYVIYDFQILLLSSGNIPLQISGTQDTAFIAGLNPEIIFKVSGRDIDSAKVRLSCGLQHPIEVYSDLNDSITYPVPVTGTIYIDNTDSAKINEPFKLVISASKPGLNRLRTDQDLFVWFQESTSSPLPPTGLNAAILNSNRILLSWNDNAIDEAGYTIERSDTYNPEFIRIAVLPVNSISFTDEFILANRFYFYRVKAIGTEYSSAGDTIGIFSSGIMTKFSRFPIQPVLKLYPNPARNFITLSFAGIHPGFNTINIYTLMGLQIKSIDIPENENKTHVEINIEDLDRGAYILVTTDNAGNPRYVTFLKE